MYIYICIHVYITSISRVASFPSRFSGSRWLPPYIYISIYPSSYLSSYICHLARSSATGGLRQCPDARGLTLTPRVDQLARYIDNCVFCPRDVALCLRRRRST